MMLPETRSRHVHCADPSDRADAIRVFGGYGHDSEDHKELVRQFVTFLRAHGIDANMDVWDDNERPPGAERLDWPPGQLRLIKSSTMRQRHIGVLSR